MAPHDPIAIAVDWLDAYSNVSIDQLVAMYTRDSIIECGCGNRTCISGVARISHYLIHQTVEYPALGLHDIWMEGGSVGLAYRTENGFVQAFLDIAENGLITRCRCGPMAKRPCRNVEKPGGR